MRTILLILAGIMAGGVLVLVAAFLGYLAYMLALSKRAREAGWPGLSTP